MKSFTNSHQSKEIFKIHECHESFNDEQEIKVFFS